MKNLLNNPWVVGALCIAAAITVYLRLFDSKSSSPAPPPPVAPPVVAAAPVEPPPVPPTAGVAPIDTAPTQLPIVGTWIDRIVRDPFRLHGEDERDSSTAPLQGIPQPGFSEDANQPGVRTAQTLRLQAIYLNGSNRIAVINSTFVKVGDAIGEFRVSQIDSDGVWLQSPTDKHWVPFGQVATQEQVS